MTEEKCPPSPVRGNDALTTDQWSDVATTA